jgi:site-specific DNA recombinase
MRIAGYLRVSTDEQSEEGYSLDGQKEKLTSYCKSQENWEIYEWYIEEGESAKDLKRPQLQRLIKDAQEGLFDIVLVYRLDRLTRSVMDLYELLAIFDKCNVKFKSSTEIYDTTTAMGKLFITLVAALAQWERENLSERVRFGMEELVRQGKWHGGPVPFGYTWENEMMHIVVEECTTLRLLRDLYLQGNGFYTIAKNLNALGRLRKGFKWTSQSVWYVLDNPFYAGKIRYGMKKKNGAYATRKKGEMVECIWSDSGFPTVFTWEEYEEHTKRMTSRQFYGHAKLGSYWFSGVIRCARCGSTMTGRPHYKPKKDGVAKIKAIYYICGGRQNGSGCNMPMLRQELAEKLIFDYIRHLKLTTERETKAASKIKKEVVNHQNELNDLTKELNAVAERRKKFQYMLVEELMSESDFKLRKHDEDEKEKFIKERIESIKSEKIGLNPMTMNMMFDLPDLWDVMDDKDRNVIAQDIFKSIIFECHDENPVGRKGKSLDFRIEEVIYN